MYFWFYYNLYDFLHSKLEQNRAHIQYLWGEKMKIIRISFFAIMLFLTIMPLHTFAFSDGLLSGKVFNLGISINDTSDTTTGLTDGDTQVGITIGSKHPFQYAWYEFDSPTDLYYFKAVGSNGTVQFYDDAGTLISSSTYTTGVLTPMTGLNVKKVAIYMASSAAHIEEFDVFPKFADGLLAGNTLIRASSYDAAGTNVINITDGNVTSSETLSPSQVASSLYLMA